MVIDFAFFLSNFPRMSGVGFTIMNLPRVRRPKMFAAIFSCLLLAASPVFGVTGNTASLTLQIIGNGTLSPNYTNGQPLNIGQTYSITAKARGGFTFTGWSGSQTSSRPKLTFVMAEGLALTATFTDKQKPILSIQTPPKSGALTNDTLTITGKARDNDAVTNVYYQLINSQDSNPGWQPALTGNGWSNWWVNLTLAPYTNTLLAYAVDRSGNSSPVVKLKMIYSAAPSLLSGMTMAVTESDNSLSAYSFSDKTFSVETSTGSGVGSYIYRKTGPLAGRLTLKFTAPPVAAHESKNVTVPLQFTDATTGTLKDGTVADSFSLSTAGTLVPSALTGSGIILSSANEGSQTVLTFLTPPDVADNGDLFNVANPLVVSLSSAYPGEIGDRVKVTFTHGVYFSGSWVMVTPKIFTGTVMDIGTDTDTVKILFDGISFKSPTDMYGPTAGLPLDIISYYYTNYFNGTQVTNGTGTFSYANYSPVGALLQLNQSGTNAYCILTFTNNSESGDYYVENYGGYGNSLQGADAGSFAVTLPPLIVTQPQNAAVTNGQTANFAVSVSGTPPLAFQWQFNGNDLTDGTNIWGSVISGSLTTNLTVGAAATNDIGSYQVIVNNSYGSVTSNPAQLAFALPPQITTQPMNSVTNSGGTASFTVAATGSLPLAYQWLLNGTNLTDGITAWSSTISGSLTTNLTISAVSTNDVGYYQVIVTNAFGSVTSYPPALLILSP
jgi:uncharacterized repeat protein (TIGR02543 family)